MLTHKSNHIINKQITSFLVYLIIQLNLYRTEKITEFNKGWNWKHCDKKYLCQIWIIILASVCCNSGIAAFLAKTAYVVGRRDWCLSRRIKLHLTLYINKKETGFGNVSLVMRQFCLWSSGQSSWLQIQRSGFDSRRYQIFSEVVGLEWGPLSLVSTIEQLLGRKSSGSSLEVENTAMGICCTDHATPSSRKSWP
jgi:hypothetical protein